MLVILELLLYPIWERLIQFLLDYEEEEEKEDEEGDKDKEKDITLVILTYYC